MSDCMVHEVRFCIRGERNLKSLADDLCMNGIGMSGINKERGTNEVIGTFVK